jgi:acylphosphatase
VARKRAKIIISGVVHGVGFRFFTLAEARALSIDGTVRNIPGGVEVFADGEESALAAFIQVLRVGPRMAHVASFNITWLESENTFPGFSIIH